MELKLDVYNYVGFTDNGDVEASMFVGINDNPSLHSIITLDDMVKEFIALRQIRGEIAEYHKKEKDNLIKALEKAIEVLKKA